jgi:hypothetical protein
MLATGGVTLALLFKSLGLGMHPAKANVVIAVMMINRATLANLIVHLLLYAAERF